MDCLRCGMTPCECNPLLEEKSADDFVYLNRGGKRTRFDRCVWTYRNNRCLYAATSHMGNGPHCQYHEVLGRRLDGNPELTAERVLFDEWWHTRYGDDPTGKEAFWHKAHGAPKLEVVQ